MRRGSITQISARPASSRSVDTGSGMATEWPCETTGLLPMTSRSSARGVIGPAAQRDRAAHEVGDQHLGGAVDGERAELGRGADLGVQRLGHAVAGGVHAVAAAEEDADRSRAVLVDDRTALGRRDRRGTRPRSWAAARRRRAPVGVRADPGGGASAGGRDPWRRCSHATADGPGRRARAPRRHRRRRRGCRTPTCTPDRSCAPYSVRRSCSSRPPRSLLSGRPRCRARGDPRGPRRRNPAATR